MHLQVGIFFQFACRSQWRSDSQRQTLLDAAIGAGTRKLLKSIGADGVEADGELVQSCAVLIKLQGRKP